MHGVHLIAACIEVYASFPALSQVQILSSKPHGLEVMHHAPECQPIAESEVLPLGLSQGCTLEPSSCALWWCNSQLCVCRICMEWQTITLWRFNSEAQHRDAEMKFAMGQLPGIQWCWCPWVMPLSQRQCSASRTEQHGRWVLPMPSHSRVWCVLQGSQQADGFLFPQPPSETL